MKKKTLIISIIVTTIIIVSCIIAAVVLINNKQSVKTENNTNVRNNDASIDTHKVLQKVIDQYQMYINEVKANGKYNDSTYWTSNEATSPHSKYPYVTRTYCETPKKYSFVDLDNDGEDELVVAEDEYLLNIYKCINNEPVCQLVSSLYNATTITKDNMLYNRSGPSAGEKGQIVIGHFKRNENAQPGYQNKDDVLHFGKANECINPIEKYDWETNRDSTPDIVKITKLDGSTETQNIEYLNSLLNRLKSDYPLSTSIKWTYFTVS